MWNQITQKQNGSKVTYSGSRAKGIGLFLPLEFLQLLSYFDKVDSGFSFCSVSSFVSFQYIHFFVRYPDSASVIFITQNSDKINSQILHASICSAERTFGRWRVTWNQTFTPGTKLSFFSSHSNCNCWLLHRLQA